MFQNKKMGREKWNQDNFGNCQKKCQNITYTVDLKDYKIKLLWQYIMLRPTRL
jgi:hypothetical protein